MISNQLSISAQGAGNQNAFVLFTRHFSSSIGFWKGPGLRLLPMLFSFVMFFGGGFLQAQYILSDIDGFAYSVSESHLSGAQSDTVWIELSLGTADFPVANVVGLNVSLDLGQEVASPEALLLDLSGSALIDSVEAVGTLSSGGSEVLVEVVRFDSSETSADGKIFSVQLIVPTGELDLDALSITAGGVVIMVDNVGLKTTDHLTSLVPAIGVQTWPNPCTDFLNVSWPSRPNACWELFSMGGALIRKSAEELALPYRISTEHLPAGAYLLRMTDGKGLSESKRIWVQ